MMKDYLVNNPLKGLKTPPTKLSGKVIFSVIFFALIATLYGFLSGLFQLQFIQSKLVFILPLTLFVFPSLLEEIFFRGILIPNNTKERSRAAVFAYIVLSTMLFVLWHPLNALTINQEAQGFFLDVRFLLITVLLGLICGYAYVQSRSIWVSTIIHWMTVLVWVFFFGGRNLVLG
jgi:predicted Abi (CAAX) family protease